MSSTNDTDIISYIVPSDIFTNSNFKFPDTDFIFLTTSTYEPFFPDPLACRLVNPLEVNHAANVSLSNGVSDLVYIVAQALIL